MDEEEIVPSTESDNDAVHGRLRRYNARFMRDTGDYSFHVSRDGRLVGGIVADGLGDTLEVDFLFVDEAFRGQGIGRRLLTHAEEKARADGLKRVLLNTYGFQAPGFYRQMGYTEILRLSPTFDEVEQFFFMKRL